MPTGRRLPAYRRPKKGAPLLEIDRPSLYFDVALKKEAKFTRERTEERRATVAQRTTEPVFTTAPAYGWTARERRLLLNLLSNSFRY